MSTKILQTELLNFLNWKKKNSLAVLKYKKERVQEVCKNIYYWRWYFIFSSAFHQSCGCITVHIPNIEYTPGFSLMVQKKNYLYNQKCVWVSVCSKRWHFTINKHTYSIESQNSRNNQKKEAVSRFSWLSTSKALKENTKTTGKG